MTKLLTAEQRVALGVIHMDENYPGWRSKIDVSRLNVASTEDCIFGQVLGGYYRQDNDLSVIYRCGFDAVFSGTRASEHGIDFTKYEDADSPAVSQYEDLQAEWLKVLAT
jgi:hypothetical protein